MILSSHEVVDDEEYAPSMKVENATTIESVGEIVAEAQLFDIFEGDIPDNEDEQEIRLCEIKLERLAEEELPPCL